MRRQKEIRNLVIALGAVGVCASIVVGNMIEVQAMPTVRYVSAAEIIVVGDVPKTGAAARDYRALVEDANYHAAFAMNPEGGYGWSDNYATQSDADATALEWCGDEGDGCTIILRIMPEEVIEIDGQPLSKTAALGAEEYQGMPGRKALALSDLGDWGATWSSRSRTAAEAEALAICTSYLVSDTPEGPITGKCRVVLSE